MNFTYEIVEDLKSIESKLYKLVNDHFTEVDLRSDSFSLNVDWSTYFSLINNNGFLFIIAKKDEDIIGYLGILIFNSRHVKDKLQASTDVIYVKPEFREHQVAKNMIEKAVSVLKNNNVDWFTIALTDFDNSDHIASSLGFEKSEVVYSMALGDKVDVE